MRILWPSFVNAARNTRCFERLNDHLDTIAENVRDMCALSARVGQCVRQKPVDHLRKEFGHLVRKRDHAVLDLDQAAAVNRLGDFPGQRMDVRIGGRCDQADAQRILRAIRSSVDRSYTRRSQ
jgi:hypothetical protein